MTGAASVEGRERLRLFVAFSLPRETVRAIARWQRDELGAPEGVRVVPQDNLHATIAFLGSRPAHELPSIAKAVGDAALDGAPPVLKVTRYRETRSVGMLVFDDEEGRAARIAADVQRRLEEAGAYKSEKRPWLPHITVARFRRVPGLEPRPPDLGAVSPSEAAVYHSVLRPGGAQYVVLESFALGG
jgi:RNA 2',3'-cyclic 3'-phosphodiesterase